MTDLDKAVKQLRALQKTCRKLGLPVPKSLSQAQTMLKTLGVSS